MTDTAKMRAPKKTAGTTRHKTTANKTDSHASEKHRMNAQTFAGFFRLLKLLFSFYPMQMSIIGCCIVIFSIATALPAVCMQQAIQVVSEHFVEGNWNAAAPRILHITLVLASIYATAICASIIRSQLIAHMTQGSLMKLRTLMFSHMQKLPLQFFDTTKHGDIMSNYTNDVDALRQFISQALPSLVTTCISMLSILCIMLWYSPLLCCVVLAVVLVMIRLVQVLGGKAAHFFVARQQELAALEGFAQETLRGQKVIQVFTHEQATKESFSAYNERMFEAAKSANIFGITLMPILFNLSNIAYALVALIGGVGIVMALPAFSLAATTLRIDIVVSFLSLTKGFASSIGEVSSQINPIVMGLAGARRIFELLDQQVEGNKGDVSLVIQQTAQDEAQGYTHRRVTSCSFWKCPAAGLRTSRDANSAEEQLVRVRGDIRFDRVFFGYTPDKNVLHDISLHARPGQKIAFVGATGAGKTTITNLINRFYEINQGTIYYDGIDIRRIKKHDLRRCLGMVLQQTNLFAGTVMENIRYGKLDASDAECIGAAKLAGADSFIQRLPEGYNTLLSDNATQLSEGQHQLLSIARAAIADPAVMILDEATSSIDTRTEFIVQQGMDALMQGRTTFVIAHRLSTVRNADTIIVLEHGRIIESGSHDELIAQHGRYYQLYTGAFELE